MEVIFCKYGISRQRLGVVNNENVIFVFVFYFQKISPENLEKFLKLVHIKGVMCDFFQNFSDRNSSRKKYFKISRIFLQVLPVEYYYHNLVGKASQGDTFYVIFSDFLKVYKTLKILNILKNSPPVKHCLHIICDIDLTLIAKIRSDCQDWGLSYLAVHCGIVSSSKG